MRAPNITNQSIAPASAQTADTNSDFGARVFADPIGYLAELGIEAHLVEVRTGSEGEAVAILRNRAATSGMADAA